MKKIALTLVAALFVFTLWLVPGAQAADLGHGGQIFGNNCAACHIGGGNVVNGAKTLKQVQLKQGGSGGPEAGNSRRIRGCRRKRQGTYLHFLFGQGRPPKHSFRLGFGEDLAVISAE
jgi:hypothetical protein